MNRYAQSAEYHGPRGLFRPVGDYGGSRFQNRVYSCAQDAFHNPGPVPSWEESRRYWSAILEKDIRTGFSRSRKKYEQAGFTNQLLSDNGIDPSQGRQSARVDNRPQAEWISVDNNYSYRLYPIVGQAENGGTGEYQVILPSLGSPFDIRHPNGMRYQYDGNGYLRVFYENAQ